MEMPVQKATFLKFEFSTLRHYKLAKRNDNDFEFRPGDDCISMKFSGMFQDNRFILP